MSFMVCFTNFVLVFLIKPIREIPRVVVNPFQTRKLTKTRGRSIAGNRLKIKRDALAVHIPH